MTRTAPAPQPVSADAAGLTRAGQHALDAGDTATAVVAFRKCAYLSPDDPLAHLHLGLALEASGDLGAARRAYRAARHAVDVVAPTLIEGAIGGYSAGELIRLLDTKGQVLGP